MTQFHIGKAQGINTLLTVDFISLCFSQYTL